MKKNKSNMIILIASILIPQAAGAIGSYFTMPSIHVWYASLTKPSFNPPNWIFGPVWTILYLMMGIALSIVWKKGTGRKEVRPAIAFFAIQLLLNILWSFLFFYMQTPFAAFIEIILLWLSILITLVVFYRISHTAGLLLVPYLLWVSFASVLNFFLWRLNG
jgi:translocator protein